MKSEKRKIHNRHQRETEYDRTRYRCVKCGNVRELPDMDNSSDWKVIRSRIDIPRDNIPNTINWGFCPDCQEKVGDIEDIERVNKCVQCEDRGINIDDDIHKVRYFRTTEEIVIFGLCDDCEKRVMNDE